MGGRRERWEGGEGKGRGEGEREKGRGRRGEGEGEREKEENICTLPTTSQLPHVLHSCVTPYTPPLNSHILMLKESGNEADTSFPLPLSSEGSHLITQDG